MFHLVALTWLHMPHIIPPGTVTIRLQTCDSLVTLNTLLYMVLPLCTWNKTKCEKVFLFIQNSAIWMSNEYMRALDFKWLYGTYQMYPSDHASHTALLFLPITFHCQKKISLKKSPVPGPWVLVDPWRPLVQLGPNSISQQFFGLC